MIKYGSYARQVKGYRVSVFYQLSCTKQLFITVPFLLLVFGKILTLWKQYFIALV